MRATLLLLFFLIFTPVNAATRRHASAPPPLPPCGMVTGTPAVTFTRDEGRTFAPTAERLSGIGYTYGLSPLDTPGTLLSWHKNTLSISTDYGCNWRSVADFAPDFPPRITPARGGRAYAWSDNRLFLVRYDSRGVTMLKAPGAIIGLGTDPTDGNHVHIGDSDGVIWHSSNGGETWEENGRLQTPSSAGLLYRIAFDARDIDHVVAGAALDGAFVSRDGGKNWSRATGLGARSINAFNLVISPADPSVVWAMAIDLAEADSGVSHGRHIYLSRDGGITYKPVVSERSGVQLVNGPIMAAHPTNPNILYFVFGTHFQGYGTDLFRFDAASNLLTVAHNSYDDIDAIAFSPQSPNVMYLGLEVEEGVR